MCRVPCAAEPADAAVGYGTTNGGNDSPPRVETQTCTPLASRTTKGTPARTAAVPRTGVPTLSWVAGRTNGRSGWPERDEMQNWIAYASRTTKGTPAWTYAGALPPARSPTTIAYRVPAGLSSAADVGTPRAR